MTKQSTITGAGWSFPPTFDKNSKPLRLTEDVEDIQKSLHVLLSTMPGERVMQPAFGCALDQLSFEPLTTTLKTLIKDQIQTSILYYEPRIDVTGIELTESTEAGAVLISINFRVRTSNARHNFVYPYYLDGGTKVAS